MAVKTVGKELSPEAELRSFLDRFDPQQQKLFRAVRTALRQRFPTVNELAYAYPNSVVLSYSPSHRGIEAVVALALRADGLVLHLSHGPQLPDPQHLLQGSGKATRFIPITAAGQLRQPAVAALIAAAVAHAQIPLPAEGKGQLIIQSSGAKRRPARQAAK